MHDSLVSMPSRYVANEGLGITLFFRSGGGDVAIVPSELPGGNIMEREKSDVSEPILVDFPLSAGAYDVSITPQDIAQKSVEALDKAMRTIQHMAQRVVTTVEQMPKKPRQVEVEFGVVLNMEAGALISKAGAEATINVRLVFESKEETL